MMGIAEACRGVLESAALRAKIMTARAVVRAWRRGALAWSFDVPMPDTPTRPQRPELRSSNRMPKRGRAGSERGRIALLHALAHIEFSAIDLAFDVVGRFGAGFPRRFVDDWLSVGADEAMHFALLERRLRSLGSCYGALPAHAGLWDAAASTADDALARLAVVPTVLEARGLDVTPATVASLEGAGDMRSAAILERIYRDEIRHVGFGIDWFRYGCESEKLEPVETWKTLVGRHVRGVVKPPFNDSARAEAGLSRDYYAELAPTGGVET